MVCLDSHTLEHNGYHGVHKTLSEWFRVLKPGGMVFISVPDLEVLARLYLDPAASANFEKRWMLTMMMFGGQADEYDFHKIGFSFQLLERLLLAHGFCQIQRMQDFNLNFADSSSVVYMGHYISLNVAAKVCVKKNAQGQFISDMIDIQVKGTPYTGSKADP